MITALDLKERSQIELCIIDLFKTNDSFSIDLIDKHYGLNLYILANQIVNNPDMSKDIVQDTLVKVWKNHKKYDSSKGRLYTWLRKIVRNTSLDYLKLVINRRNNEFRDDFSVVVNFGVSSLNIDTIDLIDNLNTLPYKNRVVIDLSYIEGFTHELISEHLSIPLGTVKSRLKIGLRELRKIYSVKISD